MLLLRGIPNDGLIKFSGIHNSATSPKPRIQLFALLSVCTRIIIKETI